LCFHELIRVVLPLTRWWTKFVWANEGRELQQFLTDKKARQVLARAIDGDMTDPTLRAVDRGLHKQSNHLDYIVTAHAKTSPRQAMQERAGHLSLPHLKKQSELSTRS